MNIDAPLALHSEIILPDYIDYNGHMNVAYYVLVFDHATDAFLDFIGITESFREHHNSSIFIAEIHTTYLQEVKQGDDVYIKTQLLGFDEKRIHFFHYMYNRKDDSLAATNEIITLYINMGERRVAVMPEEIQKKLADINISHAQLSQPKEMGRVIALKQ